MRTPSISDSTRSPSGVTDCPSFLAAAKLGTPPSPSARAPLIGAFGSEARFMTASYPAPDLPALPQLIIGRSVVRLHPRPTNSCLLGLKATAGSALSGGH